MEFAGRRAPRLRPAIVFPARIFVDGLNFIGFATLADLIITELRALDAARPGESFTVTAKVCNTGTQFASPQQGPNLLQVYLSTTPTQQAPAPGVPPSPEQVTVAELDVGMVPPAVRHAHRERPCDSPHGGARGRAPVHAAIGGAHPRPGDRAHRRLLRCRGARRRTVRHAVPELQVDNNNTFVKGLVWFGNGPDLVVRSLKAVANVAPGTHFPVEVTVCNVGTTPAPPHAVDVAAASRQVRHTGAGRGLHEPGRCLPFPGHASDTPGLKRIGFSYVRESI
ncbi:hypothetical protein [Corallococcus sp. CA054B]|uniref:hypothetical protein n=1 Tax=Corallococcus sp. CA054B TaxID=2316734 RepID=UPI0011C41558|nr:hypothetical protein [Corallococcus sp. CA054B]